MKRIDMYIRMIVCSPRFACSIAENAGKDEFLTSENISALKQIASQMQQKEVFPFGSTQNVGF